MERRRCGTRNKKEMAIPCRDNGNGRGEDGKGGKADGERFV